MTELFKVLEETKFGIICLTPENQTEPWINFEAGAIGKTPSSKVCPYLLCGLKPTDITGPLTHYQASPADKNETLKLLQDLNSAVDPPLPSEFLDNTFNKFWPDIKQALDSIPEPESPSQQVPRPQQDLLEEMLELLRRGEKSQIDTQTSITIVGRRLEGLISREIITRASGSFGFGEALPITPRRGLMQTASEPPGIMPIGDWSDEFILPSGKTYKVIKTSGGYFHRESPSGDTAIPGLPPGFGEDDLKHLS